MPCQENAVVIHSIVGWKSSIGRWSRVQASPVMQFRYSVIIGSWIMAWRSKVNINLDGKTMVDSWELILDQGLYMWMITSDGWWKSATLSGRGRLQCKAGNYHSRYVNLSSWYLHGSYSLKLKRISMHLDQFLSLCPLIPCRWSRDRWRRSCCDQQHCSPEQDA